MTNMNNVLTHSLLLTTCSALYEALNTIWYILAVSVMSAFPCTMLIFRNLRKKEHEQILINLCFALMGMYLAFILGANAAPVPVLCGISAALLQYFMLVFFSWTAVEAFFLYRKVVKVLGVRQIPVLKIGLVVWCKLSKFITITFNNYAWCC